MTESTQEAENIPVAKRNQILKDISSQIDGMEITDTIEIAGAKYVMSTLTSDEEVWADSYCNMSSEFAAISSLKIPRLAASIKSINNVPIANLFEFPDNMSKEDKEYHAASQYRKRYWLMSQVLLWLGDMPSKFTKELWSKYSDLVDRRDESWNNVKKQSARTPGGKSKATLLQEKASSQATQTSHA